MDGIGGPTLKQDRVVQPRLGLAPPGIFWASWPPSLNSCALGASRGKILTPKKSPET
jgi:hypothetical protein